MKIVIEINEEDYKIMKHNVAINNPLCPLGQKEMVTAIANGIPLPKGKRLIDADKIFNHAFITEAEEGDIFVQKYYCIKKEIMDNALVLFDTLEVDKVESEK